MAKPIKDTAFWTKRLKVADQRGQPNEAMGLFNFEYIDPIHRDTLFRKLMVSGKVLDVGCGIGRTAGWFSNGEYTGVDFVPEFIERAQQNNPDKKFICSDIRKMPFQDGEFDWAILVSIEAMIINNLGLDEWEVMRREIKRVAKQVVLLEYSAPDRYIVY